MSDPRIDRNWRGLKCNACGEYLPSLFGDICTYCTIKDKDKRIAELEAENAAWQNQDLLEQCNRQAERIAELDR